MYFVNFISMKKYVFFLRKEHWICKSYQQKMYLKENLVFPVWPRNRLISGRLEPVLSHTEKSCLASYYRQFFHEYLIKNHKIHTSFVGHGLRSLGAYKTGYKLIFF